MAIELLRRRPPSELLPSRAAEGLCKGFEGLSLKSYPDPASERAKTGKGKGDPWTIGWGHTGAEVVEGLVWTLAQAQEAFIQDLADAARKVRDHITVPLTQGEFDALTSMAFNLRHFPPPSLKACLNGGTTDKGKDMAPGSYGSAMYEFPRNCRAGGVPMRGIYRRRLAEACVFSDLPWENACSVSVIRLKVDENNNIDPVESTSLEDTLMRARQDIPDARPSPTPVFEKNWQDLTPPPKPEATVTIIEDKPELVLSTPAAPESVPAAKGDGALPPTQPEAAPPAPLKPAVAVAPSAPAGPVAAGPSSPPAPTPLPAPVPAKPTPAPDEAKNPVRSQTIWGGLITALAPQLDQMGNILMTKSGTFGPPFLVLGIIMIVLGRIGAVQPLSTSAPVRSQS